MNHTLRNPYLIGVTAFLIIQAILSPLASSAPLAAPGGIFAVTMQSNPTFNFDPRNSVVPVGTTVVWTTIGLAPHTSTSDTGLWDSGTKLTGESFSRVFDSPGVFPYTCLLHGLFGMTGTVTVVSASVRAFLPFLTRESNEL